LIRRFILILSGKIPAFFSIIEVKSPSRIHMGKEAAGGL
jgi:hypothetical protein